MARIELVNLAHSYKAHPTSPSDYALLPMTMTWDDGGAYALLGPSGCGKTTLLNIISGLVIPSEGQVLFDGKDVTDNVTNLGYFVGDEGSGAHLGKALIRAYFYRELPPDLEARLLSILEFVEAKRD